MKKSHIFVLWVIVAALLLGLNLSCCKTGDGVPVEKILDRIGASRGICVVLNDLNCDLALKLALKSELLFYVQLQNSADVEAARQRIDAEGLYGTRIFVEKGELTKVHLADNLADALVVLDGDGEIPEEEALRVLRPQGTAFIGSKELIKPFPEGVDDWSHPYHGPDNNPQSADQVARAPYLTQFLAEPYYAPLTQVGVASKGRVFKAFGNIAFHEREEALLNTLVAFNGYNGIILWKRKLTPGFMLHRNTMIATPETLYMGDDKSCKLIDTVTGRLKDEINPSIEVAGGTFWKWMALEDGTLYALIGEQEQEDPTVRQRRQAHGWPWNPLSKGFNQPEHPWGYGRNLLAINPKTKKILWSHHETEKIDSRALCMRNGRIFIFRFGSYLACLNSKTGEEIWRRTPDNAPELYAALGEYLHRQGAPTNWRTTAYLKCSDAALYFAGPMVDKLLAVSVEDGSVLWENPYSNFQLVIRDDGLYGISGMRDKHKSMKFDLLSGEVLAELDIIRVSCTRPTGSLDAIFFRASGGTTRLDMTSLQHGWISPMRPQCHDGVTIANGLLYWWPSVCDCQNTLYGVTCLGPARDFDFSQKASETERLEFGDGDVTEVASFPESSTDWPTFRADNHGRATTEAEISEKYRRLWWRTPKQEFSPTAPVAAGGLVFFSGSDGIVRAIDAQTGETQWKTYTGGAVRFPPTVWKGRVFVGSGDGWVYALEARTGRVLWRFKAAPVDRKIPVYGSLQSTWPVASGVLVEDGTAYLAAGISNFDGIHVYALDAATGKIKWQNNTSGHLDPEARTGASVQGHMLIHDGKLYLASGTSLSPAIYDITDGKCLNNPAPLKECESIHPRGWELYLVGNHVLVGGQPLYGHPDYPAYAWNVTRKIFHSSVGNRDIIWLDNSKIMCFNPIDTGLLDRLFVESNEESWMENIWLRNFEIPHKPIWEIEVEESNAMALCKNALVIARKSSGGAAFVGAINLDDGEFLWGQALPASPVPWGLAVDSEGRVVVTLKDGQVMCYGPRE